ncbi:MAG: hypothetical protein COA82_10800 [Alkaliphilus sp.]|nr:MAG: hypothetical protein COA82_10800 [Alkaliphilus sp.]
MSLFMRMILEESQRNYLMQQQYENEIKLLPKGTVILKKVGNHEYHYLKYREGKKTITDYIGKDKAKIKNVRSKLDKSSS